MTVKQLKDKLDALPDDMPILTWDYDGMNVEPVFAKDISVEPFESTGKRLKKDQQWVDAVMLTSEN
jgi:hypothetical protein